LAVDNHEFRKKETEIFLTRGLDRPSRVENVGELSVLAQRLWMDYRGPDRRQDWQSNLIA